MVESFSRRCNILLIFLIALTLFFVTLSDSRVESEDDDQYEDDDYDDYSITDEEDEVQNQKILKEVHHCFINNARNRSVSELVTGPKTFSYKYNNPFVIFDSPVLDDVDIHHVMTLSECVKLNAKNHVEDRRDFSDHGYGGGNNVTYIGGFFQKVLPKLLIRLKNVFAEAAEYAGWRPYARHLGIRCIETLEYIESGELIYHEDIQSIYTVSILLSDPTDFTGGEFMIHVGKRKENDNSTAVMVKLDQKGKGIFFNSLAYHGIEKIKSGRRVVLVIELWEYTDGDYELRPGPEDVDFNIIRLMKSSHIVPSNKRIINNSFSSHIFNMMTKIEFEKYIVIIIGTILGLIVGFVLGVSLYGFLWPLKTRTEISLIETMKKND